MLRMFSLLLLVEGGSLMSDREGRERLLREYLSISFLY